LVLSDIAGFTICNAGCLVESEADPGGVVATNLVPVDSEDSMRETPPKALKKVSLDNKK